MINRLHTAAVDEGNAVGTGIELIAAEEGILRREVGHLAAGAGGQRAGTHEEEGIVLLQAGVEGTLFLFRQGTDQTVRHPAACGREGTEMADNAILERGKAILSRDAEKLVQADIQKGAEGGEHGIVRTGLVGLPIDHGVARDMHHVGQVLLREAGLPPTRLQQGAELQRRALGPGKADDRRTGNGNHLIIYHKSPSCPHAARGGIKTCL